MKLLINADGGCIPNPGQATCGVVVRNEYGVVINTIQKKLGRGTNNTAEWTALIEALAAAGWYDATHVDIQMDSRLVVQGINGRWRVRAAPLQVLRDKALTLLSVLQGRGCTVTIRWVPRERNADADALTGI